MERNKVYLCIFLTTLFCWIVKSGKLSGYSFPVYATSSCPRNQSEWRSRSSDLNCTESNGYMCIPNDNITQLLEFCYRYPRIPIEKSICLILKKSTSLVDAYSCKQFKNGCPDKLYWSNELFKYQSCLSIGYRCFLAEPLCTEKRMATMVPTDTKTTIMAGDVDGNNSWVWVLVIGIFLLFLFIASCVPAIIIRRGKQNSFVVVELHKSKDAIPSRRYSLKERELDDMEEIPFIEYEDERHKSEDYQGADAEVVLFAGNTETLDKEYICGDRPTSEMDREQKELGEEKSDDHALSDCGMEEQDDILSINEISKNANFPSEDISKKEYFASKKDVSDQKNSNLGQQESSDRINSEKLKIGEKDRDKKEPGKEKSDDHALSDCVMEEQGDILSIDETSETTNFPSEDISKKEYFASNKDVSDEINSYLGQQESSERINSEKLKIDKADIEKTKEEGGERELNEESFKNDIAEKHSNTLHFDETNETADSEEVSEEIISDSKHQEDRDRFISKELRKVGIHLDGYEVWKTEVSEKYKELSNEERAALFALLCSDKNTFTLEDTKTLIKKVSEMVGTLDISESIQTLQSKGLVSIENQNVTFASDDVQDETMFDYVRTCLIKSKDFSQEECVFNIVNWRSNSQYDLFIKRQLLNISLESSVIYFRSQNYRTGKFFRCLATQSRNIGINNPITKIDTFTKYEEILTKIISKLGRDILIHDILDDKPLHSMISSQLKIPEEVLQWDIDARRRYLEYLNKGKTPIYRARGMIVGCAGAGKTTLLERLQKKSMEDIQKIESTVGLDVHNDIFEVLEKDGKLKDYLLFWLKSVDCYSGSEAPVILVATHAEGKSEQEKTEYYQELFDTFPGPSPINRHLSSDRYFTSSLERHNGACIESLDELEKTIVEVLKSQKHWGEEIPLDWAIFEKFISEKKETKLQALDKLKKSFDELLLLSRQEFKDLLRFYHDIGLILFFSFKDPKQNVTQLHCVSDIVILDIQWFVNSFKYVMTDSNQKASFNKVIDAAPTKDALNTFITTGEISGEFLKSIWTVTKNQAAVENKYAMMKYMERLGLIAIQKNSDMCFIPSMNRMEVPQRVKSKIHSHPNKSTTLYIRFPVLPVFLFYRLIVLCLMQGWEPLSDGRKCIYIDTAMFYFQNHVLVLGVSKSYLQLLLYNDDQTKEESVQRALSDVQEKVMEMLSLLTKTINSELHYQVGYSCTPTRFGKELIETFLTENDLLEYRGRNCPLHALAEDHDVEALRSFLKMLPLTFYGESDEEYEW